MLKSRFFFGNGTNRFVSYRLFAQEIPNLFFQNTTYQEKKSRASGLFRNCPSNIKSISFPVQSSRSSTHPSLLDESLNENIKRKLMDYGPLKKEVLQSFPSVTVINDGSNISISFNNLNTLNDGSNHKLASNTNTSLFHASWLWSNCPNHIHFTGARKRTPGQYNGVKIKEAKIISASTAKIESISIKVPIPSPPSDSCHPIPTPFDSLSTSNDSESYKSNYKKQTRNAKSCNASKQILLQVTWNDVAYPDSYYDLGWLERWRYDDFALERRRRRTEVSPSRALYGGDDLTRISYHDLIGKNKDDAMFNLLHVSPLELQLFWLLL